MCHVDEIPGPGAMHVMIAAVAKFFPSDSSARGTNLTSRATYRGRRMKP